MANTAAITEAGTASAAVTDSAAVTHSAAVTDSAAEDELTLVFSALADPTRRAILARLAHGGDATVNQLAEPFTMTQQAISKHLKVLERARLISRTTAAQSRPCVLHPAQLDDALGWIERHRQLWADRHDRLEQHLTTLRTAEGTTP